MRDLILKVNNEITADDQELLKSIYDEIYDDILYLQDIFSLKNKKINFILTNSMFYYLIFPLLIDSITSISKVNFTYFYFFSRKFL